MIILGIDPGTATTGWGVVEAANSSQTELVASGCIKTRAHQPLAERLVEIYDQLQTIIRKYKPQAMAVEELFFAKNAKTAISVGHARGVIMLSGSKAGLPVYEYTPLQVKQAVVGYGRAEKSQVQSMLKVILKTKNVPSQDDTADALAVAVCHAHSMSIDLRLKTQTAEE